MNNATCRDGIASEFSPSTPYAKGKWVWHNGVLYEFTSAHAAGAWTGTDVTSVVIGDEVNELKSAITETNRYAILINDIIPDTVQAITFRSNGEIQKIVHTNGDNVDVRIDTYTFGSNKITEVRTLNTGEKITIETDPATLTTTITYAA